MKITTNFNINTENKQTNKKKTKPKFKNIYDDSAKRENKNILVKQESQQTGKLKLSCMTAFI